MASDVIKIDELLPNDGAGAGDDPAVAIGGRLAAHRARRGVKVSALARQIGVSPSLISQIERGQSRPSVSTLFALAEALEVPVDAFFRDGDHTEAAPPEPPRLGVVGETPSIDREQRHLVRRGDRSAIDIEGGVRWERLTPAPLDDLEFMELVYAPGAESHGALYRHPGMEMVLVLSGKLVIFLGFERYELEPGDSITFPSTTPHRYLNPTEETTRAVTVILPDGGMHGPPTNKRRP
ncbi:MAG TPA: cupin domain-containing protein [Solirubrobacteraceae bacterium]|nr:cupin domain-containing protein [Solirubrobacteraceae bacterium]